MESFLQNGAVKQEFIKISLALEVAAFYALFDDVGVLFFGVFLNSELAIVFEDQLAAFRWVFGVLEFGAGLDGFEITTGAVVLSLEQVGVRLEVLTLGFVV